MPVAAIGTKTNVVIAYPAGSNHEGPGRRVEMKLTNVWAVPGLAAFLFSCRWAYEPDGNRTMINNQKFLVLPSGDELPFSEYSPHYAFKTLPHAALLSNPTITPRSCGMRGSRTSTSRGSR